jgi:hypothetical protein
VRKFIPFPLTAKAVSTVHAIHHEQGTFKTIGVNDHQLVDGRWAWNTFQFNGLPGTRDV